MHGQDQSGLPHTAALPDAYAFGPLPVRSRLVGKFLRQLPMPESARNFQDQWDAVQSSFIDESSGPARRTNLGGAALAIAF